MRNLPVSGRLLLSDTEHTTRDLANSIRMFVTMCLWKYDWPVPVVTLAAVKLYDLLFKII